MAFIQLADLIVNTDCIATIKIRSYSTAARVEDVPTVNICLMLPEGSIDGEEMLKSGRFEAVEQLEFEGDFALAIWNYFVKSSLVEILFE